MTRSISLGWLLLGLLCLAGCASSNGPAPVETRTSPSSSRPAASTSTANTRTAAPVVVRNSKDPRPATHTVAKGETLYSISLEYGFGYRELAAWNQIDDVNLIKVGQVLRLTPPNGTASTAAVSTGDSGVVTRPLSDNDAPPAATATGNGELLDAPKAQKLPYSDSALAQMQAPDKATPDKPADKSAVPVTKPEGKPADKTADAKPDSKPVDSKPAKPADDEDGMGWLWPVNGKVVRGFNEAAQSKGIDIAGKRGTPVMAAAAGKVVYAGNNLRGYGRFVIVKHNDTYLTVYAHNDKLLVKEGQTVERGQRIAEMGDSEADQVALHFEIRRYGKPVDPSKLLPAG